MTLNRPTTYRSLLFRHIIFGIILLVSALHGAAQPAYRASVKKYISYSQDTIALTHCRIADVVGKKFIADQTLVMVHGIITATGNAKTTPVPTGATVIDCSGKTVLPGFVMLHEHMYYPAYSNEPYYTHFKQLPVTFPRLYLACGVTTARTAGSVEPYSDLALKRGIDSNEIIGPTLYATAPYLEGRGGFAPQMHVIKNAEEARSFVNFWADEGFTSFKAYMNLDSSSLHAAIDAAHKRGLKITGHLCSVTYRDAAQLGIDQLEHGFFAATDFIADKKPNACVFSYNPFSTLDPQGPEAKNLVSLLVQHNVILTSTLAVFEGMCTQDSIPKKEVIDVLAHDTRDMYVQEYSHEKVPGFNDAMKKEFILEKEYSDAGGLLTVGTDPTGNGGVLAGYGSLRAIELLTKEGFTPIEAIRIATYNGAMALNAQKRIGSIEVGKDADIVIVTGNVADDINNIENTVVVFRHGVGFDSQKILKQMNGQVGKY